MAQGNAWFVEYLYLESKLDQLRRIEPDSNWDTDSLKAAISDAGYTPLTHFQTFGHIERTSPNAYFHAEEYLEAKLRQLQDVEPGRYTTIDDVADAISAAGMTTWEHFQQHGWKEGVNPSNAFDLNQYFEDKLAQLYVTDAGANWTLPAVKQAFEAAGLDPITHFFAHGWFEGLDVAAVPESDRVPGGPDAGQEEPEPQPDPDFDSVVLSISPEGWTQGSNHISFNLRFDSDITFDGVSVDNSVLTTNISSLSMGGITTVDASLWVDNAQDSGTLELEFLVPSEHADGSVSITDFSINRISYPDKLNLSLSDTAIEYRYADLITDFTLISETPTVDSSGEAYSYQHINEALTTSPALVGLVEVGAATQAYLHIEQGGDFEFDHDTFLLRASDSGNYRIKFTPENPAEFSGNIIGSIFHPHGNWQGSAFNVIGHEELSTGALYSDPFFLQAEGDNFLSLSMRWWNRDEPGAEADGPAPYQIELIADSQINGLDFFV